LEFNCRSGISENVSSNGREFSRGENDWVVRALCAFSRVYTRVYQHVEPNSACPLPRVGPAIVVSNHTSSLDPLLIQSVCPRLIRWMMAKEYFDIKAMRPLFDNVGVILVERSGRDMAATRAALRALEKGFILGVFPEGRIATDNKLLPFQNGIGMLATKSKAPVYPIFLDGNQRGQEMVEVFWHRNQATITFGPPVDLSGLPDSRQAIEQATERIQTAVNNLRVGALRQKNLASSQ
jgi:1-acyl-sn-glycerol-3-phosphate acyltransferase